MFNPFKKKTQTQNEVVSFIEVDSLKEKVDRLDTTLGGCNKLLTYLEHRIYQFEATDRSYREEIDCLRDRFDTFETETRDEITKLKKKNVRTSKNK